MNVSLILGPQQKHLKTNSCTDVLMGKCVYTVDVCGYLLHTNLVDVLISGFTRFP